MNQNMSIFDIMHTHCGKKQAHCQKKIFFGKAWLWGTSKPQFACLTILVQSSQIQTLTLK